MSPKTPERVELLQGTLELLILRTLRPGPMHGHAIAKYIQQTSQDLLQVETGSLYPALHRLAKGWIEASWEISDKGKRARYYRLTLRVVIAGLVVGAGLSYAASRLVASQLFGVAPQDPFTLASSIALVIVPPQGSRSLID